MRWTALLGLALLAGCTTSTEDRLDDAAARADEISAVALRELPPGADVTTVAQADQGDGGAESWTSESTVGLAPGRAADVAADVSRALAGRGWTTEPTVDQGGTTPLVTVHRHEEEDGEWVVQVLHGEDRLVVVVQSPVSPG